MRTRILFAAFLFAAGPPAWANGLLVPADYAVPPLSMVSHRVTASIDEQVAVTTVEQVFRNHTSRPLEATYLFTVPRGASVNKFSMWVDGRETAGELLEAKKAAQIYTDIVRRTQDPGLLEYLGNDLLRLRVFPVPPHGDQRVKLSFTAVATKEGGLVEYLYPMKTDGRATRTLEDFAVRVDVRSAHPVHSVYSPTHAVRTYRQSDREVRVEFERSQAALDKDFQLFFATGRSDIGITPIVHKPMTGEDGFVMLLVSPQVEAARKTRVPRDLVIVLDKSGSMTDVKMTQARKAVKHCLANLGERDRFAVVAFSTTVSTYEDELKPATAEQVERASRWVDDVRQSGGTAILPALTRALDFRGPARGRSFTVVFVTDGLPTVDETDPAKIVKAVQAKNTADTRIFTFGVGDDVNAAMLDQLADVTRAASTYVRPAEDIEAKVAALHGKISHPVMTDVKLTLSGAGLTEVYPPNLPDLFYGSQLVVIGKLRGSGPATVRLTGRVGGQTRELVEEFTIPARTDDGKEFVEHLWARRKVGYLLDQIRANGEQRELVDEVTALARRYGIATPYTSYLVVPDGPLPVAAPGRGRFGAAPPAAGMPGGFGGAFGPVPGNAPAPRTTDAAREAAQAAKPAAGGLAAGRGEVQQKQLDEFERRLSEAERKGEVGEALAKAKKDTKTLDEAARNYRAKDLAKNQTGTQGVDLALASNALRNQDRLTPTANRAAYGRQCVEVGGVWIDEGYDPKLPTVAIRSQGKAYFRILERRPEMKDVYRLGNHVVWLAPSGAALVLDPKEGQEDLPDAEIDKLFVAKK
jgi:Ca-activated chloride channel family protein